MTRVPDPQASDDQVRVRWSTKVVTFRMRADEHEALVQAAGSLGHTVSSALRLAARSVVEAARKRASDE